MDTSVIDSIISGNLVMCCRLCLCPLSACAVDLSDVLVTPDGELPIWQHLMKLYPELNLLSVTDSTLSHKMCLQCLKDVKLNKFNPQTTKLATLQQYVNELYEILENYVMKPDDKVMLVRLRPIKFAEGLAVKDNAILPDNQQMDIFQTKISMTKNEAISVNLETDGSAVNVLKDVDTLIKEDLDTDEFDDMLLIVQSDVEAQDNDKDFAFEESRTDSLMSKLKQLQQQKPKLKCQMCGKKYRTLNWLTQHQLRAHGLIACPECGEEVANQEEFRRHTNAHEVAYSCDMCARGFKFHHSITLHLLKHQREKWKDCQCPECGTPVWDDTSLKQHIRRSHGWRPDANLICFYCGKAYICQLSFDSHIQRHESILNTPARDVTCKYCGILFSSKSVLRRHRTVCAALIRGAAPSIDNPDDSALGLDDPDDAAPGLDYRATDKENKFQCETCSRAFVDARALRWHSRLHTGERPYPCLQCDKHFISRYRRNQHALTAHTPPRLRCPLCPALFHLTSMVNTHIKKVHLREHKRHARPARPVKVHWSTEQVAFSDLSVQVQAELLNRFGVGA